VTPVCPPEIRAVISGYIYDPRNEGQPAETVIDDLAQLVWGTILLLSLEHVKKHGFGPLGPLRYDPREDDELRAD
jgi:hypothetical protein